MRSEFSIPGWPIFSIGNLLNLLVVLAIPSMGYVYFREGVQWRAFDYYVGAILCAGFIFMVYTLCTGWHFACRIRLNQSGLDFTNWALWTRTMPYASISKIVLSQRGKGLVVKVSFLNGPRCALRISDVIRSFGELLERILAEASNLSSIGYFGSLLREIPNLQESWQKEPDWDIISAAIARAEENRKKQEQQS